MQRQRGSLILSPTGLFPEGRGQADDFLQGTVWAAGGAEQAGFPAGEPSSSKGSGGLLGSSCCHVLL